MSAPYIGEIRQFAGNFAPAGWALCQGQIIAIADNDTLFNLIGTTYGGDGQETFGLPNLQSRVPNHMGQGPGLSNYVIGGMGGVEQVTLTQNQLPSHSHLPMASNATGTTTNPAGNVWSAQPSLLQFNAGGSEDSNLRLNAIVPSGGNQPHDNIVPYLAVNYIISLYGVYPSQS